MTEYIRKEELKTFPSEVEQLIIKTDFTNPIETLSFCNSLIDMGKYFLTQAYTEAVKEVHSPEEMEKFMKLVEKRHLK
ncbi:MAG: hypothetical protein IJH63_00540 [Methanobrevibacter sp.]|nr:hypothetical protein [Methanosphaera sp.]MBR0369191.1 hypothetical protein [Methanobrevibacter sp.]